MPACPADTAALIWISSMLAGAFILVAFILWTEKSQ